MQMNNLLSSLGFSVYAKGSGVGGVLHLLSVLPSPCRRSWLCALEHLRVKTQWKDAELRVPMHAIPPT